MKYKVGDLVKCPSSGPHAGPRIGKIKQIDKIANGNESSIVLVGYIDYPEEFPGGWFCGVHAWVKPIGKIIIQ
jgi:hypothetical protein